MIFYQLKEASVREANATPPTIGTRDNITHMVGICFTSSKKLLFMEQTHEMLKI